MKQIAVVGIGMGNKNTITIEAKEKIDEAQLLIGAKRLVEVFERTEKLVMYKPEEIAQAIRTSSKEKIVIVMSGDTGFYSGTKKLLAYLSEWDVTVYPGISSISYLAAKIGISWEDAKIVSLHGRKENLEEAISQFDKVFLLTAGNIDQLCKRLTSQGFGDYEVYIGECLSYPEEKIIHGKVKEMQEIITNPLTCCFFIANGEKKRKRSYGISDESFIRGNVPITKSEVRAVTMSKLALKKTDIVYDIGAGTGSVSIEMAIAVSHGKVYAIEYQEEAQQLILQNKEKFGVENLELIKGMAPEAMKKLPNPDVAFLGGTKGNMEAILIHLLKKNKKIHVVINAIAMETITTAMQVLTKLKFENLELVQVFCAKGKAVGNYHMMTASNPVFIISADGTGL